MRYAIAAVLVGSTAHADPVTVSAEAHVGLATAPFDAPGIPDAKGQALSVRIGGAWTLAPALALDVRVPVVVASVAQPAGSYVDATALGNPQLGVVTRWGGVRLALPLARGDSQRMGDRALAIANGISGLGEPESFDTDTAAVTPFVASTWSAGRWSASVEARVPVLVRDDSLDVAAVLAVEVRRNLSRRLTLAVAPQLAIDGVGAHDLERVSLYVATGLAVDVQGSAELSAVAVGVRYARAVH